MGTAVTGSELASRDRFFYGWFIVGILFFISIIDGGFTYIFSAFLKPLSQEFGWTRADDVQENLNLTNPPGEMGIAHVRWRGDTVFPPRKTPTLIQIVKTRNRRSA